MSHSGRLAPASIAYNERRSLNMSGSFQNRPPRAISHRDVMEMSLDASKSFTHDELSMSRTMNNPFMSSGSLSTSSNSNLNIAIADHKGGSHGHHYHEIRSPIKDVADENEYDNDEFEDVSPYDHEEYDSKQESKHDNQRGRDSKYHK